MNLVNTYEKIFETVWHNYTCGDVELNLWEFLRISNKLFQRSNRLVPDQSE